MDQRVVIGLVIPFLGTVLGAGMVFLLKNEIKPSLKKLLSGFAGGVMMAASVWSLLLPSIEMSKEQNTIEWLPALLGFVAGILFLLLLDEIIPHLHVDNKNPEGLKSKLQRTTMLVLAVTLHNIPEGMVLGVILAGALMGSTVVTFAGAMALAVGIAIQNFPEGAIISMPLKSEGLGKGKAFLYGALSGIVEPIAAVITLLLTESMTVILPYMLSFAAGAMIYVVVEELIPESQMGEEHSNIGTLGVTAGFALMMVLDIAFG